MERSTDIIIVGGGVIGCAIAYYLRKQNRDVIVLEQEAIGAQASSAAAGLLAPLGSLSGPGPFADLMLASFALFPHLVLELEEISGLRLGYEQTGALRTIRNSKRITHLKKRMDAWQSLGLHMYWLNGDEARQREPLLSLDICAAIYVPEESQIKAPQFVKALAHTAEQLGAKLYSHTQVTALQRHHTRVTGVETARGETITCKHLILATGAWSAAWNKWLHLVLPIRPQRGQIIAFQPITPSPQHLIFGDAAYLASKGDMLIVGATKEDVGFDTQVTTEGITWLHNTAEKLLPILKRSSIYTSWAGLRPTTPDTCPILGPTPHWDNVTLAIGHNSVGILLSPITGQIVAEYIATEQIPEIMRSFSLERLADRQQVQDFQYEEY